MAVTSTLSSKGQVTVPIEVRRRLGLQEGDQVEFVFEEGRMILRPVRATESPFAKWVGVAPQLGSKADVLRQERELRGRGEDKF